MDERINIGECIGCVFMERWIYVCVWIDGRMDKCVGG